jgi:predicted nucleic acid-binding protein
VILVDTSVWIDHLRTGNATLGALLVDGRVLTHPFVIGELALASLRQRSAVPSSLSDLPAAAVATDAEVLGFIDRHSLFGRGVGYIDVHLLAAMGLTVGAALWTNDRRLQEVAESLGVGMKRVER